MIVPAATFTRKIPLYIARYTMWRGGVAPRLGQLLATTIAIALLKGAGGAQAQTVQLSTGSEKLHTFKGEELSKPFFLPTREPKFLTYDELWTVLRNPPKPENDGAVFQIFMLHESFEVELNSTLLACETKASGERRCEFGRPLQENGYSSVVLTGGDVVKSPAGEIWRVQPCEHRLNRMRANISDGTTIVLPAGFQVVFENVELVLPSILTFLEATSYGTLLNSTGADEIRGKLIFRDATVMFSCRTQTDRDSLVFFVTNMLANQYFVNLFSGDNASQREIPPPNPPYALDTKNITRMAWYLEKDGVKLNDVPTNEPWRSVLLVKNATTVCYTNTTREANLGITTTSPPAPQSDDSGKNGRSRDISPALVAIISAGAFIILVVSAKVTWDYVLRRIRPSPQSDSKMMESSGGELASVVVTPALPTSSDSSYSSTDKDGTDSNQNAATVSLKVMMPELASVEQAEELVQSVTTGNLFKLVGNNDTKLHPDWNFDAFKFARETVTPLAMMAMHVMEARNLPSRLKLDRLKLARLLLTAERGYTPANPYHNAVHAANVVRTLYCILNAAQADAFSPAMEFAALLAAVMHDVGHPGRSNAFMVKRRKFSFVINEGDVNEQVSAMIMKIMLSMPELDIFQTKVHGEHLRTAILNLCIELILITSFARYSALTSRLEAILEDDGDHFCGAWGVMREDDFTNQEAISLLELALVCSDIGHVCDEWGVHEEWVARLTEEFHLEGDDVKLDGQKPAPFMDRDAGGFFNLQDGQVGFLENVALPLMRLVPRLFGEKVAPLVTRTEANKWKWQTLVEARRASEKHVSWASSNKEAK